MLLLLPSISAVEYSTVEDNNKAQVIETIQNLDIETFKKNIRDERLWNCPFLTAFVKIVLISQYVRGTVLGNIAEAHYNPFTEMIPHPIIYLWAMTLLVRMSLWAEFWHSVGIDITIF